MNTLFEYEETLGVIVVGALVTFDVLASFFYPQPGRHDPKNTATNLGIALINFSIRKLFWYTVFYYLCSLVAAHSIFRIQTSVLSVAVLFVLVDFVAYWRHWIQHKVRFFWAIHSVHHSSPHYNHTTDLRSSPFAEWFRIPTLLIFPLLGFSTLSLLAVLAFFQMYDTFNHNQWVGKLGFLDRLLVTPSNHRVHHGKNPQYLDKNFSTFFIVWDFLFGTYEPEVEKVEYGLTKGVTGNNPLEIVFYEFRQMGRDMRAAQSLGQLTGAVVGRPADMKVPDCPN